LTNFDDDLISLYGSMSVIGRTVVLHQKEDGRIVFVCLVQI
jgi:hypothetical protein